MFVYFRHLKKKIFKKKLRAQLRFEKKKNYEKYKLFSSTVFFFLILPNTPPLPFFFFTRTRAPRLTKPYSVARSVRGIYLGDEQIEIVKMVIFVIYLGLFFMYLRVYEINVDKIIGTLKTYSYDQIIIGYDGV